MRTRVRFIRALNLRRWAGVLPAVVLFIVWGLVVGGMAGRFPLQVASWLTFLALLITPGYFLADLLSWRLRLDLLERLALALPLGMAVLAVPGTIALLQHQTLADLAHWWTLASGLVILTWLLHGLFVRALVGRFDSSRYGREPWTADEIILALLLAVAFVAILPALSLNKIDGDAYAVATFATDALAGLPMNAVEPLFGTDLGPGVRMIFNQYLSLSYLWSHFSGIDPITLTAVASRSMLALWALFASYTLGKAAGGSRRFGLFLAAIQLLIYLAAPFIRGDNASLFYFERTNADKFMVPITMLPVVFAFAIHFVRTGRPITWVLAALATFAVSTIHPLIAAMLALAAGAFAVLHLLLNLRRGTAWKRAAGLGLLVVIVMVLPMVQLVLARGEAPLAPSYPDSFEGWPLGSKRIPILPFVDIETLTLYGPLPEVGQVQADEADEAANPLLLWRFAVNMERRRIILFDLNHYISDPSIVLEPPYLLALVLLPAVIWRRRHDVAAQFAVATTLAILLVMFNPVLTPLIGSLVMPWILWRFIWLLPYALIIALALRRLLLALPAVLHPFRHRPAPDPTAPPSLWARYAPLGCVLLLAFALNSNIAQNVQNLHGRAASPYFYPTPQRILNHLQEVTAVSGPATVLADSDLSVTLPAHVAQAAIIAHRAPTTSEVFPADQQHIALQRLIDQQTFFNTPYLTTESLAILRRYEVEYIVVPSGSQLDMQLQLLPQAMEWVLNDQTYALYAVRDVPAVNDAIRGNTEMAARRWTAAADYFEQALAENPDDLLALAGMAEVAHANGQFDEALSWLERALAIEDLAVLHYRLGLLYVESGELEAGMAELERAQEAAPRVARFHVALGDACVAAGRLDCATEQYELAVDHEILAGDSARLVAQGDLWRQQNRPDLALPYYEEAARQQPSEYNLFLLESVYREAEQFESSAVLLADLRQRFPLSPEVLAIEATARAAQGQIDPAVALYREAIQLQNLLVQESAQTRLALAQLLLAAGRLEEARLEIDQLLALQPYNAAAHRALGDLHRQQGQYEQATNAYQRAFQLDPTQIDTYIALSDQLKLQGEQPQGLANLLQETIAANPDEALLFLALGDQLQTAGNPTAAAEAYQAALDRLDVYTLTPNARPVRPSGESRAFIYSRLARAYEELNDTDTALNYYRAAVAAAPATPWTHVLLGGALRRGQETAEAEQAYLQALDSDAPYVDAYVQLAELYIDTGRYTEADNLLHEALESEAGNTDPYMRLAELEQRRGQYEEALGWLREATEIAINTRTINIPLMDALARYGDYETAGRYLEMALAVRPSDADLMLRLSQLQVATQDDAAAQATLLKGLRLDPQNPRLYTLLADVYVRQGQAPAAVALLEQAISHRPDEASLYITASQLALNQGNLPHALALLKAGLQQASQPDEIYIALSTTYAQQGELALAQGTLEQALRHQGESPPLLLALGRHYVSNSDYVAAQQQYKQVLELHTDDAAAYAALGDMFLRRDNPITALANYRQALEIEPENPSYALALANAYAASEQETRAEAAYQLALHLLPTYENAYLDLAAFYAAQERTADALATYERALALNPASGRIVRQYATFLAAQEDTAAALALLNEAVAHTPEATTLLLRASLQATAGNPDAALQDLEQARQLAPGSMEVLIALGDQYREREAYEQAATIYAQVVELAPNLPTGYLRLGELAGRQGDLTAAAEYAEAARAVAPGLLTPPDDVAQ